PLSLSPSGAFVGNHREKPRNPLPAFPFFFPSSPRACSPRSLRSSSRVVADWLRFPSRKFCGARRHFYPSVYRKQ
ncbi:hypothetical protein EE612_002144, partial [Oryza sativa]